MSRGTAMVAAGASLLAAAANPAAYGPVGNDTLWTVATKINAQQHLGTTAQVAWALYKMNPEGFDGAPGRIHPDATLMVPDAALVTSVGAAQAYASLSGTSVSAKVATAAPASMPVVAKAAPPPAPPPVRSDPHAVPVIEGVEVKPVVAGRQALGVIGAHFRPGAKLQLHDMINGTTYDSQAPSRIAGGRIDIVAKVGAAQSNWLVTVRNADGTQSEAFGFAAGPGAQSTGLDELAARQAEAEAARRAAQEAEQQAAAQRATAEQAAAEKVAADKAAAEQAAQQVAAEKAAAALNAADKAAAAKAAHDKAVAEAAPASATTHSAPAKAAAAEPAVEPRLAGRAEIEAAAKEWAAQAAAAREAESAQEPAAVAPSVEPADKAELQKAVLDKIALDREFEEKMAADRAAYEKAEARAAKKR